MRLGAPNLSSSLVEKPSARSKTAARTSRPNPIDVRDAAHAAPICAAAWMAESASITPPVRQMKPVSPTTTPLSMMRAFSVGRYRFMAVAMTCKPTTNASIPQYGRI